MEYQINFLKNNIVNGQYGVYSFVAKLNKQKKTGVGASKIVQLKIVCGGEVIVNYDYGWVKGHTFISLYQPLVEHLDGLKRQ